MLDRLIIIRTKPYTADEVREIIKIRAREEKVTLSNEALEELTKIGVEESLRYAIQLLAPAQLRAQEVGHKEVTKEDVEYVRKLFLSVKESIQYIKEYESYLMR
jgi:TBP-interacting protein